MHTASSSVHNIDSAELMAFLAHFSPIYAIYLYTLWSVMAIHDLVATRLFGSVSALGNKVISHSYQDLTIT